MDQIWKNKVFTYQRFSVDLKDFQEEYLKRRREELKEEWEDLIKLENESPPRKKVKTRVEGNAIVILDSDSDQELNDRVDLMFLISPNCGLQASPSPTTLIDNLRTTVPARDTFSSAIVCDEFQL